ncbi:response regulator transcription factor [Cytobacillus kochii]|uniref:response regulator transcription factor n=1 Tax=Cytobacillus kochii TaxID=859143 RepID=UPI00203C8934|nr:response regulator transcription factor [Cytobacillus kochii]MCM3324662.1 response regulator transcription factor [Cytobacillus kochii]MCM3347133.1 response regulator transcription factor [Cytobacillus kochii]
MVNKVLIVDDHLMVREGLKLLVETSDKYLIIGEAQNGKEAITLTERLNPDVILMDLYMPVMSGLEAIKEIKRVEPKIPIVILTTYNEDKLMAEGIKAGAQGYLLKDTSLENLFQTMDSVIQGETLLQSEIEVRIKKYESAEKIKPKLKLTQKELTILQAVSQGFTSKEIASDIGVAERTVKARLTSIYNKLGVDTRAEAVAVAINEGFIHM